MSSMEDGLDEFLRAVGQNKREWDVAHKEWLDLLFSPGSDSMLRETIEGWRSADKELQEIMDQLDGFMFDPRFNLRAEKVPADLAGAIAYLARVRSTFQTVLDKAVDRLLKQRRDASDG